MIKEENLHDLTDNFVRTYNYVENNVVSFLAQFDEGPPPP